MRRGVKDVVEGSSAGFREVFREGRGDDFDVCETYLREELASARGRGGEDDAFLAESCQVWEI